MVNNACMQLKTWITEKRGRSVELARALGVVPPVVSDWLTGKRPVPLERCTAIEVATGGQVTRRDLRPADWHLIWPELATGATGPALQQGA